MLKLKRYKSIQFLFLLCFILIPIYSRIFAFYPIVSLKDTKIYYKYDSNTKVQVYIQGLKGEKQLNFLENFNSGWKIYLVKNPSKRPCSIIDSNDKTVFCKSINNFIDFKDIEYIFKTSSFKSTHAFYNNFANSWKIDSKTIEKSLSHEYYIKNHDGSINLEIVIFFLPQAYFMLFSIFSFIFLILILGMLIWHRMKYRK